MMGIFVLRRLLPTRSCIPRRCLLSGLLQQKQRRSLTLRTSSSTSLLFRSFQEAVSFHRRYESSVVSDVPIQERPIRILYASQGGTAQLFAMQLYETLSSHNNNNDVTLQAMDEDEPQVLLQQQDDNDNSSISQPIYVFLTSTAGVGEPPNNGRQFFQYLQEDSTIPIDYCMFGLGNAQAHPNHYNSAAKQLNKCLLQRGATPLLPLALGDDGECLEDDFDQWQDVVLKMLSGEPTITVIETKQDDPSLSAKTTTGHRLTTPHAPIELQAPQSTVVRPDLLDMSFYLPTSRRFSILNNTGLNQDAAANGLHELQMDITGVSSYETGDHCVLYPRNSDCVVEAYLQAFPNVQPHAILSNSGSPYQGLTVFETLSHCVDLGALPSPTLARQLCGDDINYKRDIFVPRRTVLDLWMQTQTSSSLSLPDLLFHYLPRMQPRYYSIASSSLVHPNTVYLTYRPVRYYTTRGVLREGVCTSYMSNLTTNASVIGNIQSNPTFRLPPDPLTPVVFMAGGCGVAPIRAFLEHRMATQQTYGPALLFLGFRNPADQVYHDLVEEALRVGAIREAYVSYTTGAASCGLVTDSVQQQGVAIYQHLQNGGYTYLCGGARTFGVAVENTIHDILKQHGSMNDEQATAYLQKLIHEGRFCEDLAD